MIHFFLAASGCNPSSQAGQGLICGDNLPHGGASLTPYFNIAFALLGAIALFMVVVGGLRYITNSAQSNANGVSEAKRMIVYAVIGLVVAGCAAAIVNFALGQAK